jgi:hypothetical protein
MSMIRKASNTLLIVIVLWAVREFIISPLNLSGKLDEPAVVTAIVCCLIAFLTITIPFIIKEK